MGNKLIQRNYVCNCGAELKELVWDNDIQKKKFKCSECGAQLGFKNIKTNNSVSAPAIRTPTKNR